MKKLIILTAIFASGSVMAAGNGPTSCPGNTACCQNNSNQSYFWATSCGKDSTQQQTTSPCMHVVCPRYR